VLHRRLNTIYLLIREGKLKARKDVNGHWLVSTVSVDTFNRHPRPPKESKVTQRPLERMQSPAIRAKN
jgi:hypothetical protein